MFQVGDSVIYGAHGVCRIAAREIRRVDRKNLTYLVLEPFDKGSSRYYVPVHNEAAMSKVRSVLSRQEMENLIHSESVREDGWIRDENKRKQSYKELIVSGDREKLLRSIHSIYRRREALTATGRKIHLCDDNFLRDAEKMMTSEIAATLDMTQTEARDFLRVKLNGK